MEEHDLRKRKQDVRGGKGKQYMITGNAWKLKQYKGRVKKVSPGRPLKVVCHVESESVKVEVLTAHVPAQHARNYVGPTTRSGNQTPLKRTQTGGDEITTTYEMSININLW